MRCVAFAAVVHRQQQLQPRLPAALARVLHTLVALSSLHRVRCRWLLLHTLQDLETMASHRAEIEKIVKTLAPLINAAYAAASAVMRELAPGMQADLLVLAESCKSVIACRCRPDQKKKMLELVKHNVHTSRTLAVGASRHQPQRRGLWNGALCQHRRPPLLRCFHSFVLRALALLPSLHFVCRRRRQRRGHDPSVQRRRRHHRPRGCPGGQRVRLRHRAVQVPEAVSERSCGHTCSSLPLPHRPTPTRSPTMCCAVLLCPMQAAAGARALELQPHGAAHLLHVLQERILRRRAGAWLRACPHGMRACLRVCGRSTCW